MKRFIFSSNGQIRFSYCKFIENSYEIISKEFNSVTRVAICLNNFKLGDSIETTLKHINESRASIKLIVAAPELLEVCIHIVASYEIQGLEDMKERDLEFYEICKDAVKKATE